MIPPTPHLSFLTTYSTVYLSHKLEYNSPFSHCHLAIL